MWKQVGAIKTCNATYYSQIHVVWKTGKKPRIAIDFRGLNGVTELFSWPLPDIKRQLHMLRGKRFLLTLDLTDAYGQCALDKQTQHLSAFMTKDGLYHFTRLPFGLSGAVSYFAFNIYTIVLVGLVGKICDYYWGGALWQQMPGETSRRWILFVSGTFAGAQLGWPINEKEMYSRFATSSALGNSLSTVIIEISVSGISHQQVRR